MFTKLPYKHNLKRQPYGSLMYRFGKELDGSFKGISYYRPYDDVASALLAKIPSKYWSDFIPTVMVINYQEIPPHIDNGILTTINFYVDTADAVTSFYKETNRTTTSKLPNQTDGSLYDVETLEYVSSFKAEANDVYVLDVKQIHSVSCSQATERFVYCLQTSFIPYDEVIKLC